MTKGHKDYKKLWKRIGGLLLMYFIALVLLPVQAIVYAEAYEVNEPPCYEVCIEAPEVLELFEDYPIEEEIETVYEAEDDEEESEPEEELDEAEELKAEIEAAYALFTPFANDIANGTIGSGGAPWTLYDDGTLIVESGLVHWTGATSPWLSYNNDITKIIFEDPTAGTSLRGLFSGLTNLQTIEGLALFDMGNVTSMQQMFSDTSSLMDMGDISSWDTSNVTIMHNMFYRASSLNFLNLSGWNTGSVINMGSMFRYANSLTAIDGLSGWDTGDVTTMGNMFRGASSLINLDGVSGWDTGSVENMSSLFMGASSLETLDLSGWDTSSVTNMGFMFGETSSLTTIGDISSWDTSQVTNMERMFRNAGSLTALDLSGWDTSNVSDMFQMFLNASSLNTIDVSGWDTGSVENMGAMFRYTSSLETLDLSSWDTSSVTSMSHMFSGAVSLWQLTLGEDFNFINSSNPALPPVPNTALFAGHWINVGAGTIYVPEGGPLAPLTSAQLMATFDGAAMADTWVWQRTPFWGISLTSNHTFPTMAVGYGVLSPHTATAANTGNQATGDLTITLTGANPSAFALSSNGLSDISVNGSAAFTVVPIIGLGPGTHTATVTVAGGNGILQSFDVSFTVTDLPQPPPTWGITLTGDHIFPDAIEGYDAQTPHIATVTNIGNQPTGVLVVSLSGTNADAFTIDMASIPSIAVDGTATFTVVPNQGLTAGAYTAVVTVSGDNGISESFTVSFTVTEEPSDNGPDDIIDPDDPIELPQYQPQLGNSDSTRPSGAASPGGRPGRGILGGGHSGPLARRPEPIILPHITPPDVTWFRNWFIYGYPDGTVGPNHVITRAEMLQIFYHLSTDPDKYANNNSTGFTDLDPSSWYFNALAYFERAGLLVGFPDGTVRPGQPITNAEFVSFAIRFFNIENLLTDSMMLSQEAHWAAIYVNLGLSQDWLDYFEIDADFNPDMPITRVQAIALLNFYQGRTPDPVAIHAYLQGRNVFPDIQPGHWIFYEMIEAAISRYYHYDENGSEHWISSPNMPRFTSFGG